MVTIFESVSGKGNEHVVLLHGWGGCDHRHMQPIVDILQEHYRISSFDLPGIGRSTWDNNFANVHDIADAMLNDLPEEAIYIGWSFGGSIATSIAARFPERVKRYIGLGNVPKFIADENWPGVSKFRLLFENEITRIGMRQFFINYYDMEFDGVAHDENTYGALVSLVDSTVENSKEDVLLQGIDICDSTDLREEFKNLQCPVDLVLGSKDPSVPAALYEHLHELNPAAKLHILEGAKHMPFWTHQEEFTGILQSILGIK